MKNKLFILKPMLIAVFGFAQKKAIADTIIDTNNISIMGENVSIADTTIKVQSQILTIYYLKRYPHDGRFNI